MLSRFESHREMTFLPLFIPLSFPLEILDTVNIERQMCGFNFHLVAPITVKRSSPPAQFGSGASMIGVNNERGNNIN